MYNLSNGIRALAGAGLVCLLATSGAWAQSVTPASRAADQAAPSQKNEVKPALLNRESDGHRMEIYNGSTRTVRYFSPSASPSEQAMLRDLEQAENSLGLVNQLSALIQEYVVNERSLQAQRRMEQQWNYVPGYYGYSTGFPGTGWPNTAALGWGNYSTYASNYYGYNGMYGSYYDPYAYGLGAFPITAGYADPPDSPLHKEIARTLASQATPEYAAKLRRDYDAALARAGESPALAKSLGIKKGDVTPVSQEGAAQQPGRTVVTMKDGHEFTGKLVKEDNDRLVLDTAKGEVEIRKSETTTIVKGKAAK
jgi:hypothetical protein